MADKPERPTLKSLAERLDSAEQRITSLRVPDPEGSAISRCVQALDALPKVSTGGYNSTSRPDSNAVARILVYLGQRYGLPDPGAVASRLAAENETLRQRNYDLEHRLNTVRGAADATAVTS